MSNDLSVTIEGLDKVQAMFSKAPELITSEMKNAIQRALILLQASARQFVARDTSQLGESIKPKMINALYGELNVESKYGVFVHEGTAPHWPPIEAIEPWARRHGIPPFLVARSIAQKGTPARPFMQWAKEATEKDVFDLFSTAIKNIVNKMS